MENIKPDRFKDLRGVKCPLNFVHTKVQMSKMSPGQILEIYIDDGEPIQNVPASVKLQGNRVLSQEKIEGYWRVLIQKE